MFPFLTDILSVGLGVVMVLTFVKPTLENKDKINKIEYSTEEEIHIMDTQSILYNSIKDDYNILEKELNEKDKISKSNIEIKNKKDKYNNKDIKIKDKDGKYKIKKVKNGKEVWENQERDINFKERERIIENNYVSTFKMENELREYLKDIIKTNKDLKLEFITNMKYKKGKLKEDNFFRNVKEDIVEYIVINKIEKDIHGYRVNGSYIYGEIIEKGEEEYDIIETNIDNFEIFIK